jgi:D-alanyl-lipoteichoic acid acyltransferase DltB (MBOAT superfamily)
MVFNTVIYLFFLAIVVILYYVFPRRIGWIWLLIASIGYYMSFIPIFLFLLAGIVFVNYFLSIWLAKIPEDYYSEYPDSGFFQIFQQSFPG